MTRKQVDKIVMPLVQETRTSGRRMTREEIEERTGEGLSKGQKERIFRRYHYLSGEQESGL